MPKKKTNGKWGVDMRPDGYTGKRVRREFDTKAEAQRFETHIKSKADQGEWNPKKSDTRRLYELCELWYEQHGKHLKCTSLDLI